MLVWLKRPVPQIDDFILALIGPERGDGNYCLRVADFGHQLQTHRIPIRRFDTIYRFKFRSFCNLCLRGNQVGVISPTTGRTPGTPMIKTSQ